MGVRLVAKILEPRGGEVLVPLLEELKIHEYDPPELIRCVAHDEGRWNFSC
jgi:hypothetical protein